MQALEKKTHQNTSTFTKAKKRVNNTNSKRTKINKVEQALDDKLTLGLSMQTDLHTESSISPLMKNGAPSDRMNTSDK